MKVGDIRRLAPITQEENYWRYVYDKDGEPAWELFTHPITDIGRESFMLRPGDQVVVVETNPIGRSGSVILSFWGRQTCVLIEWVLKYTISVESPQDP